MCVLACVGALVVVLCGVLIRDEARVLKHAFNGRYLFCLKTFLFISAFFKPGPSPLALFTVEQNVVLFVSGNTFCLRQQCLDTCGFVKPALTPQALFVLLFAFDISLFVKLHLRLRT